MTVIIPVKWAISDIKYANIIELRDVGMRITNEDYKKLKSYISKEIPALNINYNHLGICYYFSFYYKVGMKYSKSMCIIEFNPNVGGFAFANISREIPIPEFMFKYMVADMSSLSPYNVRFTEFKKGISQCDKHKVKIQNFDLIRLLFPALYWITECESLVDEENTVFYFGYNGYYIGYIEKETDQIKDLCYNQKLKVCVCGYH